MVKIYHGIAVALLAINLYVLVYYGMRWYRLLLVGEEILPPLDFVFRDIRYFVFVIFYATALALSKWLEKAAVECEFLTKKEEVEK
jgi:cytochrome c oxidase subunit IV